jgi:hypothetical protein
MAHHHFPFIVIPIGFAAFYVAREFLQAGASRWRDLAQRFANSTAPDNDWQRIPFLWVEWTSGRTLSRATSGRSRMTLNMWGQFWETLFPTLRVAATRRGLHLRRQPWHFRQPPLLIPWKAVAGFQLIDGSEAATSHAGSLHPAVGAAIHGRLPGAVKAVMDAGIGEVARIDLKEPKLRLLLPADAIGDATRYVGASAAPTPSAPLTPAEPTAKSAPVDANKRRDRDLAAAPAPQPARPPPVTSAPAQPPPTPPKLPTGVLTVKTGKCAAQGHPEFTLAYDPRRALERDVRWYAGVLEQLVASGSCFKPADSIQLGWSVARVTMLPDGTLSLEEFDLKGMPPKRQAGVTESLRVLRLQKDTLESVLPVKSLTLPSLTHSCIVCTRLAGADTFIMQRSAAQGEVSGWFIGCADSSHDHNVVTNLKKVLLYEAVVAHCRGALQFLGFPPGSVIGMQDEPAFFLDGTPLSVRQGSFLDRAQAKRVSAAG